jgi:predicted nucleic acid-binding protein
MGRGEQQLMTANRVLFDTTILIDLLERRPRVIARLRTLADQGAKLAISIVSAAEIYSGTAPGEEERTAKLLDLFDVIPMTDRLAKRTGELVAARRRLGRAYSLDDMMIAATAIELGYLLYTSNRKDFEVPRISFYSPER